MTDKTLAIKKEADAIFADFDFGAIVEDFEGWSYSTFQHNNDLITKHVYSNVYLTDPEDPDTIVVGVFHVYFDDFGHPTEAVCYAKQSGAEMGTSISFPPSAPALSALQSKQLQEQFLEASTNTGKPKKVL